LPPRHLLFLHELNIFRNFARPTSLRNPLHPPTADAVPRAAGRPTRPAICWV